MLSTAPVASAASSTCLAQAQMASSTRRALSGTAGPAAASMAWLCEMTAFSRFTRNLTAATPSASPAAHAPAKSVTMSVILDLGRGDC